MSDQNNHTTRIGKMNVEYFPAELIELQKELDAYHPMFKLILESDGDMISKINELAAKLDIALDGNYYIKDVAEACRKKLVEIRTASVYIESAPDFLPPVSN